MISAGMKLIASLVAFEGTDKFDMRVPEEYFRESEQEVWAFIRDHFQQYGVVPAETTVQEQFESFKFLKNVKEPPAYHTERMRQRYYLDQMRRSMQKAKAMMDITKESFDIDKAFDGLMSTMLDLKFSRMREQIIDFRHSHDLLHEEYVKVQTLGDDYGIRLGWPTLDQMSGGMVGDDMITIVGRPAAGKTFMLMQAAHYCWMHNKKVLVISMEMKPIPILQRMAAIHTHYNLTKFKKAEMSTKHKHKVFGALKKAEGHEVPLYIVDGNLSATTDDVLGLCQQFEPDVALVDGAYLLMGGQSFGRAGPLWERVTRSAEGLKKNVASTLGIPVIASYQFNREATKKQNKKGSDKGGALEDIGYSDAIGQLSSLALGMLQHEGIETSISREVDILKGRNGEQGRFSIHWDFQFMNFSEILDTDDEGVTLKFL